jgi:hypothetical protein
VKAGGGVHMEFIYPLMLGNHFECLRRSESFVIYSADPRLVNAAERNFWLKLRKLSTRYAVIVEKKAFRSWDMEGKPAVYFDSEEEAFHYLKEKAEEIEYRYRIKLIIK